MRKHLSLLFVLVFSVLNLFAQQQLIDSLLLELQSIPEDTSRVINLSDLARAYVDIDIEQAQVYTDEALQLTQKLDYRWGQLKADHVQSIIFYYTGRSKDALELAKTNLDYVRSLNRKEQEGNLLNFISIIYQQSNELESALDYTQQALELAQEQNNQNSIGTSYHTLANIYHQLEQEQAAKNNFLKALAIFEELDIAYYMAVANQGLATVTEGAEAQAYAEKALELFKELGNAQGQAMSYGNLADVAYDQKAYSDAQNYWEQALQIYQQLDFPYAIASTSSNLGLLLTEIGDFEKGYEYLLQSSDLANGVNARDILLTTYRGLANYHAFQGNPTLVQQDIDSLMAIQDTIFSREKVDLVISAETRFKTKEKEVQIAQQTLEIERQNRLRNIILLSALAAILGLIALFQYIRNRQRIKQKEAELALQLERSEAEQLRELDQLKSNFFANISHEFRTPLTLILGPLEQMRRGVFEGDRQQYFDIMHRNGKRLQDLINQLLDLSKLENSNMQLDNKPGDAVQFIRQLANSMESWAVRKHISYELNLPEQPVWVNFDKDKLEKVVVNLLSNALKFTPQGETVTLDVQTQEQSEQAVFSIKVQDTGIGIPASEIDKVFERFYHSTTNPDGTASSGIGLALTKELVEFQNGSISVESEEGKGTTFFVTLPFAKAKPGIASPQQPTTILAGNSAIISENTSTKVPLTDAPIVLIVEDNEDVRTYIKDQLSDYQLLEAVNGKAGLGKAIETVPDLIITDVMMPEMDGTELTKQLKTDERTSHIPVIMLTAKADRKDKLEGLETGADDYLIKPFDAEELRIRVQNLIEQRRKLRERFTKESLLSPKTIAVTSVDEQFLARLMEVIEENMDTEQLSIEDVGRQVGMSRSQLHRKLKALTDKSPSVFVRSIRLQRAKQLLRNQAGNATEIAFMVGFSNAAYFSKCFKDEFGMTPTEAMSAKA